MHLKESRNCSEQELADFERLVREGFDGSDASLPARMRQASRLAFCDTPEVGLVAIAGLKSPAANHVRTIFEMAELAADPSDYVHELGWVYVTPGFRRRGLAAGLCRKLLDCAPRTPLFATTRVDNAPMQGLLGELGFQPAGRPYPHRSQMMRVFLRR